MSHIRVTESFQIHKKAILQAMSVGFMFMLLETNRLIIEYFNTDDIRDWAEIESDADVRRFVDGKVLSLKQAGEYVE